MAEIITLDTPVQAVPGATRFRPTMFKVDLEAEAIIVRFREAKPDINDPVSGLPKPDYSGKFFMGEYRGAIALAFAKALNTANLPVKSLYRRLLERFQTDGKFGPGAISGTPD